MQWKWGKLVRRTLHIGTAGSWSEPADLCPFELFDRWNMQWFVTGTRVQQIRWSPDGSVSPPLGLFLIWVHTLPVCSLPCRSVTQTLKLFAVETAPKSFQIPSSSALLSWCGSARLHLIQSAYSNVHWFKIHLIVCQSMSTGLLGCLSLPWKIAFLLKKRERLCIRDQSIRTRFSWSAPKSMMLEGQQENGPTCWVMGKQINMSNRSRLFQCW